MVVVSWEIWRNKAHRHLDRTDALTHSYPPFQASSEWLKHKESEIESLRDELAHKCEEIIVLESTVSSQMGEMAREVVTHYPSQSIKSQRKPD